MKHIIKRHGHNEAYDTHKLYASIFAACATLHVPAEEAESIAQRVTNHVTEWLQDKPAVTSHDLFCRAAKELARYHPDAAHIYFHHLDIN